MDRGVVEHALKSHPDADGWFLNGDSVDMEEASTFAKGYTTSQIATEHNEFVGFLSWLGPQVPWVRVIKGNHCARADRGVQRLAQNAVKLYSHPDPMTLMCKGFTFEKETQEAGGEALTGDYRVSLPNIYYESGLGSWYSMVGDVVICHKEAWAKHPTSVFSLNILPFFSMRPQFRDAEVFIQGHTHRQCHAPFGRYLYIEGGAACHAMSYAEGARSSHGPMAKGYVVLHMNKNGRCDRELTRVVHLGTESLLPTRQVNEYGILNEGGVK
jgi:hypothetical protein